MVGIYFSGTGNSKFTPRMGLYKVDAIITVTDIIIVGLMPKRAAVSVLIDTARIALPILVFLITILRISIKITETPNPIICTMEILKAPKSIRPPI